MIGRFTDVFRSFYEHICGNAPQQQSPGNAPSPRSHTVDTVDSSDIGHDEFSPQECECVQNDHSESPSPSTMFDRPMMLLYLLAANPDFMLPLASIRPAFGEMATSIPQASACRTPLGFSRLYFIYLRAVVNNRLWYAINCLFPHVDIMCLLDTQGHYDLPELEQGPVPILEYIVRDAMTLCNPIDYMVTFLERMVSHYRMLTTDHDRRAYRSRLIRGDRPLQEIYMLSHIYGRYMWDSRWASDATLHQLVQLFEILTTEILPTAFKQRLYYEYSEDDRANRFAFDIIFAIVPCFLHHYRPMQRPHLFAVPCNNVPSDYSYPLPEGQLPALMETLERDLMQAASEYIEHPESFSTPPPLHLTLRQDGSSSYDIMADMPTPSLPSFKFMSTCIEEPWPESGMDTDTDEAAPPTPQVLPSPFTLCTKGIDNDGATATSYNSDDIQRQISPRLVEMANQQTVFRQRYLEPHLPFKDFFVDPDGILYLTLSIVLCPPKDDPVYVALSPIFDQLKPLMISPLIDRYQPSPQFRCLDPETHTHTLPDPWFVDHPSLGYHNHTHVSDIVRNTRL